MKLHPGLLVLLALAASRADAHPPPPAEARLEIVADGSFELTIDCDAAALVMQSPAGHLGPAAAELREMPAEELESRIADARRSLLYYLRIDADGARLQPAEAEFPAAAALREASDHSHREDFQRVRVSGRLPADVRHLLLTFPPELGRVKLAVVRGGETIFRDELAAGVASAPIDLAATPRESAKRPAGTTAGDIIPLALLAIALLILLCWPRRR